jgi:hypothetical protein
MEKEPKLRQFFICNNCRTNCPSGKDCTAELDTTLYPRKQMIECLGEYCDQPCGLRKKWGDLEMDQLIVLIKYLGKELNELLIKKEAI